MYLIFYSFDEKHNVSQSTFARLPGCHYTAESQKLGEQGRGKETRRMLCPHTLSRSDHCVLEVHKRVSLNIYHI